MTGFSQYSEQELLLRISQGDEAAFRAVVHRYAGLLFTYIQRHTESKELAEELVQDIFLQIWLTRETLGVIRNFRTYLYVISRNHAINAVSKLLREEARLQQWCLENIQDQPSPEEVDAEKEQLSLLEEAIQQLPPQQRQAWLLSRREGKTYHQVASEMKISRETVKSYLKAATNSILKYVSQRTNRLFISIFF